MKRTVAIIATLALLALGGQAFAEICTIDAVPAATLLLPYFSVDFASEDQAQAITTFFSVNNASAAPALAHVTLWTNISLPTIDFDLYLTGYDVQIVNLATLFRDGTLPVTATPNQDPLPADAISPHGNNPAWDDLAGTPIDGVSCNPFFPFSNPALDATNLARIRNGHTGQPIFGTQCLGRDVGNDYAEGYITIDSVSRCSVDFPGDAGYFQNGGLGVANNNNQLWGDYFIVDPGNASAYGDSLVHIEADETIINGTGAPGTYNFSFYNRFTFPGAADNREPLANAWGARYQTGGAFSGGTRLAVWRDSRVDTSATNTVDCGSNLPFAALEEGQVVAFSQQEDAISLCEEGGQISPPQPDVNCFPWETNWVNVGTPPLDPPYLNGWLYLNLDLADVGTGTDPDDRSQAWVTSVFSALNLYEVGYAGIQLQSACFGLAPAITGNIQQAGQGVQQ